MNAEPKRPRWTRQTRSRNKVGEQIRKRISDKVHFKPSIGGFDMQKRIIALTKRRK